MYEHGGNIYEIQRFNKIDKNDIIDFSSNINPLGIPEILKEKIINNINNIRRYPDPDYFELKESISNYYDINKDYITVGNGATELIYLLSRTLKPKKTLIISPSFLDYEKSLLIENLEIEHFELEEKNNFEIDVDKLKNKLINKYDLVIICNPNNPTGVFLKLDIIENIVIECNKNKSLILIDESFIDFIPDSNKQSVMNILIKYDNVILLKSLTKFFAIPGLRLGFTATSNVALKNKIDAKKEPWTINVFAEIAGINIFNDKDYIEKTIKLICEEKELFLKKLVSINQLKVFNTSVNFFLIKLLNEMTSEKLKKDLIRENILIRDASNFKFLNNKFIRIAVKNRNQNLYFFDKITGKLKNE